MGAHAQKAAQSVDAGTNLKIETAHPSPLLTVVRYEDLQADPSAAFRPLPARLGLPADEARLEKAIRFSSFGELARQEASDGFRERSANQKKFFRSGTTGGWRGVLPAPLVRRMVRELGPVMRRFGYLGPDGQPV